ncbi:unnamed protein product [Linum trigynum]|uniref:Uncharacterized protein n=1 Tax=Linum trigynum TaxID=586398 RepID=A0AAV2DNL9_9ROSI
MNRRGAEFDGGNRFTRGGDGLRIGEAGKRFKIWRIGGGLLGEKKRGLGSRLMVIDDGRRGGELLEEKKRVRGD